MELKIRIWLSLFILVFLPFSYVDASDNKPSSKKILTIKTTKDTSLSELITSSGYDMDDKDLEIFLRDFTSMNRNIKSLSTISKGTIVRLPLKTLKAKDGKIALHQKGDGVGAKKKPRLKLSRHNALILKNIKFLLDSLDEGISMKSEGIKVFSFNSKSELSFDTSFFPLIEIADNNIIMLDYKGVLPEEIKDIIEINWPEYTVLTNRGAKDIKNIISLLLDSIGYFSFSDNKVVLDGKPKTEFFADFVIKKNDDTSGGKSVVINIVGPKEYRTPDELIKWAKDRDVKIIELFLKESPLYHKRAGVIYMSEQEIGKFSERFLTLLGYKFRRGIDIRLSDRKEYEFNIKADLSTTLGKRTKVIDFSEISEQAISYAKRRGFDIINIDLQEGHSDVLRKVMGLLSINYKDKPETTSFYITPKGVKYQLMVHGILFRSKNRLLFAMAPEIDAEFLSAVVSDGVTLIRY